MQKYDEFREIMTNFKAQRYWSFFIYLFDSVVVLSGTESDLVFSFVDLILVVSGKSKLIFALGAHSVKLPVTICVYMKLGSVTHYFWKILWVHVHTLSPY